jgi:putative hydrolase of the HAD superfamily
MRHASIRRRGLPERRGHRVSRAVIFDLDDTLYPEAAYVDSGFRAVAHHIGQPGLGDRFLQLARRFHAEGSRGDVFDRSLRELRLPADPDAIATLVGVYRDHVPELTLFDDALPVLEAFASIGPTGILTDGYAVVQRRKVTALDLELRVNLVVYSDDFGRSHWKPSETPYRAAMQSLAAREYVYVADNPTKDFVAARRLGWFTVQVLREHGLYRGVIPAPLHEAHTVIRSLADLRGALP